MRTILVTGAGGNASQSFVESLRLAGRYRIIGVDINRYHLGCADLDKRFLVPPLSSPEYLPRMLDIVASEDVTLLHAQPDVEVEFYSVHRDKFPTFLPSHDAILTCHNKVKTNKRLLAKGVPVPRGFLVDRIEDIPEILSRLGDKKVWLRAVRGAGSRAALPVTSKRQAEEWIHYWRMNRELESRDFMISEFLPGKEFAFQSIWNKGELVTSQARERMEYMFGNLMPSGQSSSPSVARTVHREDVNETAYRAVLAVDEVPYGIYCVDMKEDADGVPRVTEINIGRFFTTSNFFSHAGCNMPDYYVRLAHGEDVEKLKKFNAVNEGLYWVRGVDRIPRMFTEESLARYS